MKVIIAGGREFKDFDLLEKECDNILKYLQDVEIVEGGCTGADRLGRRYATSNDIPYKTFNADWKKFGNSAGPRRNQQMAEYADMLIAFWNGTSRGTKNMIDKATELDLEVHIIKY